MVVTIDESFLQASGRNGVWPMDWAHHAALLRAVLALEPRGVFLDFVFQKPRGPAAESLGNAIDEAANRGQRELRAIPVVLGETPDAKWNRSRCPDGRQLSAGRTDHDLASAATGLASIQWPVQEHPSLYPFAVAAPREKTARYPTPAPALHAAAVGAGLPGLQLDPERMMMVAWNLRGSTSERQEFRDCDFLPGQPGWVQGVALALGAVLPGIDKRIRTRGRGDEATEFLGCNGIDVVSAWDVEANRPAAALLQGRYVLIGSARGIDDPDTVLTALGGQVPGVMLHAMALDNLLRMGPANVYDFRKREYRGIGLSFIASVVALGAGMAAAHAARITQTAKGSEAPASGFFGRLEHAAMAGLLRWAFPLAVLNATALLLLALQVSRVEMLTSLLVMLVMQPLLNVQQKFRRRVDHAIRHGIPTPDPSPGVLPDGPPAVR